MGRPTKNAVRKRKRCAEESNYEREKRMEEERIRLTDSQESLDEREEELSWMRSYINDRVHPESGQLDTLELINEIMIRPEIWMSKHPANRNKWKTLRKWEDMRNAKFSHFTVDDLKKRWKNIKDQYRKELKKIPPQPRGGGGDGLVSSWKYFEFMTFLKDELAVHRDKEEPDPLDADAFALGEPSGSSQDYRMVEVSDLKIEHITESPQHSDPKSEDEAPSPLSARPRHQPKEVREELLRIEQRRLQILEAEAARTAALMKSDSYQFLMSILPEMEKLPTVNKMRLRIKISQAVLDEVTASEHAPFGTMDLNPIQVKEESINMYD